MRQNMIVLVSKIKRCVHSRDWVTTTMYSYNMVLTSRTVLHRFSKIPKLFFLVVWGTRLYSKSIELENNQQYYLKMIRTIFEKL